MKAVILAAGLGTRLLTTTKSVPKEMFPVFCKGESGELITKPFIQLVFETLYDAGFRDFIFVVGKGKNAIREHFTPDQSFINLLRYHGKEDMALELEKFYEKVEESTLIFVTQREPLGTGDAVLNVKKLTGQEPFLVHFGDDLLIPLRGGNSLLKLKGLFNDMDAEAAVTIMEVDEPFKYGIAFCEKIKDEIYRIYRIEEKPPTPKSNFAIVSNFIFKSSIYRYIEKVGVDNALKEVLLTAAIESLIEDGGEVYALLASNVKRLEVGSPKTYEESLRLSAELAEL